MAEPLVALVGRPNVGKSTLFNRLIGERRAIVEDVPGTTRDRLYGGYHWNGRDVSIIDTGGLALDTAESLPRSVMDQARVAIDEADVIVMVADVRDGVTPLDQELANVLRRAGKPVVVAVNKADNRALMRGAVELHALGLGDPVAVSAERGLATGDLLDVIDTHLPQRAHEPEDVDAVRIAIVGRPNVGKSSLLNTLLGTERMVISPTPGTTRDAVDTAMQYKGHQLILVDTAGIRRRGRVVQGIEHYSVLRAQRAIDRADVAVLVVDATEPLAAQDAHIAGFVEEKGKGLVVAVNKWDLVQKTGTTMAEYERALREELKFVPYVPFVFISAVTGQRATQVLEHALSVQEEREKRVTTGQLNDAVRRAIAGHEPSGRQGRVLRVLYIVQVGVAPPTFVAFVNDPDLVHFSFRRFLENRLREQFGFFGSPIRIVFRGRQSRAAGDR